MRLSISQMFLKIYGELYDEISKQSEAKVRIFGFESQDAVLHVQTDGENDRSAEDEYGGYLICGGYKASSNSLRTALESFYKHKRRGRIIATDGKICSNAGSTFENINGQIGYVENETWKECDILFGTKSGFILPQYNCEHSNRGKRTSYGERGKRF